jgi:hypothetical protein
MTLALLLPLVGAALAAGPQTRAKDQRPPGALPAQGAQAGTPARQFETAPLEFLRPMLKTPFRSAYAPKLRGGASEASTVPTQPQGKVPSTVCAIQVIKADPALDPGFVVRVPAETMDPIVRKPPCVAPE